MRDESGVMVIRAPAKESRRIPIYFLTSEQRQQFLNDAKAEGETASSFMRWLYREWLRSKVNSAGAVNSADAAASQIVKDQEGVIPK